MTTFVDSCVIFSALREEEEHHEWSVENLDAARDQGPLLIPDLVFAELCYDQTHLSDVIAIIEELGIERHRHTDDALFLASKTFRRYKDNGGGRKKLIPDFLIGAVARTERKPLLTTNEEDYLKNFEGIEVICPNGNLTGPALEPARKGRRR